MERYRKKPVVISALQWKPGENESEMLDFLGHDYFNHGGVLQITTLEGVMSAQAGDWIIKGLQDEFYPCKDSIFQATYEPVK